MQKNNKGKTMLTYDEVMALGVAFSTTQLIEGIAQHGSPKPDENLYGRRNVQNGYEVNYLVTALSENKEFDVYAHFFKEGERDYYILHDCKVAKKFGKLVIDYGEDIAVVERLTDEPDYEKFKVRIFAFKTGALIAEYTIKYNEYNIFKDGDIVKREEWEEASLRVKSYKIVREQTLMVKQYIDAKYSSSSESGN